MVSVVDAAISALTDVEPPSREFVDEALARPADSPHSSRVHEVIDSVRMSRPRVTAVAERGPLLSVVTLEAECGILVDTYVLATRERRLDGIRFEAQTPTVRDVHGLATALADLGADAVSTCTRRGEHVEVVRPGPLAVASLMKVFVIEAVLAGVDDGVLALDESHRLRDVDIAYLSAGLGAEHVGTEVTVGELCSLSALQSDNSATDLLVRLIGPDRVLKTFEQHGVERGLNEPFRTTKDTFLAAWGEGISPDAPHAEVDATLRVRGLERVAHGDGHDYVSTLTAVDSVMGALAARPWHPWSVTGARAPVLFKGGSAPGVLAGAWFGPGADRAPAGMSFCVNAGAPLGALEEIYAFSCAESLRERLGLGA
ncbi:hypothetical protein ET495_04075 [Xylanimonas allomyrinae]|uniref:Beta-lactamase class A catalytic domain-containing protein n=1 Tax=Xylanimonas allomyrinae TaxID=2509459 RepID=A0A4P6EMP7_9MICO|nr:serine hydrolase [Xylanimonas allomyrinae]QAY62559.1 hypothetical protein ET495_04075 [Xylanimonas allomyrinae]